MDQPLIPGVLIRFAIFWVGGVAQGFFIPIKWLIGALLIIVVLLVARTVIRRGRG